MLYHLYLSFSAALICVAIVIILKYVAISKMRIDNRDKKKKPHLTTVEVLTLLRKLKPFPVSVHKGWKLNSFRHNSRVWCQEIEVDTDSSSVNVFASYVKIRVPAQVVLQILKDVSKTPSWKPNCLATSITSRPTESEPGFRNRGNMGNFPVQHDIVMEETSPEKSDSFWSLLSGLYSQRSSLQTEQKENRRYWHREDNGVCWHLQMCEAYQEWLFFLAQPVEDVEECLITLLGYQGKDSQLNTASFVSEVLSSLVDYIQYRKLVTTPLHDLKLPTSRSERLTRSYSSSEDPVSPGMRIYQRFRSLVEKPSFGSDRFSSVKQKLIRSTSILRHKSSTLSNNGGAQQQSYLTQSLKTSSLDRRKNMPELTHKDSNMNDNMNVPKNGATDSATDSETSHSNMEDRNNDINAYQHNVNAQTVKSEPNELGDNINNTGDNDGDARKDIDQTLDEDVNYQEQLDECNDSVMQSSDSKEVIQHRVQANHTAAELLAVAVQASNIDLSKSIQDQVINSGGWMFCGLENDVVVLKKVSIKENLHCYLGKGIIQADTRVVWNAIRNPRTKFTYDDSLKKVDVLETVSDSIKIVYYYHEVLQLFKTECCDMVVSQSERIDKGDRYILAMQSFSKPGVTLPDNTVRVKVLPSGWIIEPVSKDKKVFSMVTYIMQIDFGELPLSTDKAPFEDLISKQPMSIAYLRQYLRGCTYLK